MENTYLSILELQPGATKAEIKSAYRRLSKQYHPDLNADPGAPEKFIQINEAYRFLTEVGPRPHHEPVNYAYDPQAEEFKRRREQAKKYARKMAEAAYRRRNELMRKIVEKFSPVAVFILGLNVVLLVDQYLPLTPEAGEISEVHKINDWLLNRSYYGHAYDDIYMNGRKVRLVKGQFSYNEDYDRVELEYTFILHNLVSIRFYQGEKRQRFEHVDNLYSMFDYLIPLMLLSYLFFQHLFKGLENKLTMALVIIFLFWIQFAIYMSFV